MVNHAHEAIDDIVGRSLTYSFRPPPHNRRMKPPMKSTKIILKKAFSQLPLFAASRPAELIEVGVAAR